VHRLQFASCWGRLWLLRCMHRSGTRVESSKSKQWSRATKKESSKTKVVAESSLLVRRDEPCLWEDCTVCRFSFSLCPSAAVVQSTTGCRERVCFFSTPHVCLTDACTVIATAGPSTMQTASDARCKLQTCRPMIRPPSRGTTPMDPSKPRTTPVTPSKSRNYTHASFQATKPYLMDPSKPRTYTDASFQAT
jgi:hypothetical protein